MRKLIVAFTLLTLSSPAFAMAAKRPKLPEPPRPREVEILAVRTDRLVKIEVNKLEGFNGGEEIRFRKIAANTEKVVNLKAFREMVLAHKYDNKNIFVDTPDAPKVVYEKITSADWKLYYKLEWLFAYSTVGYTRPDVLWIVFNSRRWAKLADAEISANICHEYGGHKFGRYSHAMEWNTARDYSVPYALGTICETLYRRTIK